MVRYTFLLLLSLTCFHSYPQYISPFTFTNYSTANGLVSNELYGVQQDRAGYIWIATNNGLQRFDGTKYKTFQADGKSGSIPSNTIHRLFIDNNDVLWMATSKGEIGTFDKKRYKFTPVSVKIKPALLLENESKFLQDDEGHVFFLVLSNQLLMYDKVRNEFSASANYMKLPPEWRILTAVQQPGTKKWWFGLQGKDGSGSGIAIYNGTNGHLNYLGHNPDNEPAVEFFKTTMGGVYFFFDTKNRLWFQRWAGGFPHLIQYDGSKKQNPFRKWEFITRMKQYHELRQIMQQRDGRIWIRGYHLLGFYDEKLDDFILLPNANGASQGITYQDITTMFEDREANIWVGTAADGLYRFNPEAQLFTNVAHPSRYRKGELGNGSPMSFIQLKNGDILSGTWEDGLFQYNSSFESVPLPPSLPKRFQESYMWSMFPSMDGQTIWMSAQPGMWRFNQKTATAEYRNPAILKDRTVRQVAEDKTGALWLGMHGAGVYRWVQPFRGAKDSVVKMEATANSMVNKIVVDTKGLVWIATGNNGLFIYDPVNVKLIKHLNEQTTEGSNKVQNGIISILEYSDSVVIVASVSQLYYFNRYTNTYRIKDLSSRVTGMIAALEKDANGNVWLSSNNALYRLEPYRETLLSFNKEDGMLSDRFELSSSYKMPDGRMIFGNTTAFVVFDPRKADHVSTNPTIAITGIQVGKQDLLTDSVLQLDKLQLSSKDNSITVDFSTLRYADRYIVQYKMEGIDDEWKTADLTNRIAYPFLPVGRWKLLLRAYSADGATTHVTELQVQILPPWYQTWWFYTLLAIVVAIVLYWIDKQRSKRKASLQKIRTDIAASLHEEVNTALNNINILSEIARLKSEKEPQKAKEFLEQIHSKSHNMIITLDDMLWSLAPENDAMDKTIQRIKEFADSLKQRHNVMIDLLIDKKVEKLELNMKMRHEAFLLFKEALRSLVEAGSRLCVVHLTSEKGKLLFTIEFENEHCDMQKLNNLLHRRDMELRLHNLGAKLNVQIHKSRSVFLLQLPLG